MPGRYRLSRAAERRLDEIFRYTRNKWGEAQAIRYLANMFDQFEAVATGSISGRPIPPAFGVSGRFTRCGKHFIYWKTLANGDVGIAEILHERMNIGDHLALSPASGDDDEQA